MGVASGEVGVYQLKNVPHTADEVSFITHGIIICAQLLSTVLQNVLLSVVQDAVQELHS